MVLILLSWKFLFLLVVMTVWSGFLPTTQANPGDDSGAPPPPAHGQGSGSDAQIPPAPPAPHQVLDAPPPPAPEEPPAEEPVPAATTVETRDTDQENSDIKHASSDVSVSPSEITPPKIVREKPKRTFWHGIVRRVLNMNCFFWRYLPSLNPFASETREMVKTWILFHGSVPQCLKYILEAEYTVADTKLLQFLKFSKVPIIWVLGPPGSGKGTMCKQFANEESYTHISVGELIREELKVAKPKTAKLIETTIEHGDLLPGEFVVTLLVNKMLATYTKTRGFLVDGFPRAESQAMLFREMVNTPDLIIVLEARQNILLERILSRDEGRSDDNEETFKHRYEIYTSQIEGIKKNRFFKKKINPVNAEVSKEECYNEFSNSIKSTTKVERKTRSEVKVNIEQKKQKQKPKNIDNSNKS